MWRVVSALAALLVAGTMYFVNLLFKKRRELDGLPCPPITNKLLGHLEIAGDCRRLFPPGSHMHNWPRYMQKKYGLGDYFYIDWWPVGPRWLFISDPELVSQYVTTTQSLPKSPLETAYLNTFLGDNNMVSVEGQHWKMLRSMFNPGFSASHLMTLVPYIVDASFVFCNVIRQKALQNELFELEEYATRLTIDIIGKVVLDSDFDSQKAVHPIVDCFRKRVLLMPQQKSALDTTGFELRRRFKLWLNGRELDRLIGDELDQKIAARASSDSSEVPKSLAQRKRSVIDLALDAYQKEQMDAGKSLGKPNGRMDTTFRKNAVDSMKTFIFAGHDTTASTIAYVFYLLHFHPKVHKRIVDELETVFGSDATIESMGEAMKKDPYIINQLEYTTAVIKETLRLFPPASTLRQFPTTSDAEQTLYMTDPQTGQKLPLSGWHVWPIVALVGRNEAFFPQPLEFIPERFIPSMTPFPNSKLFTPAGKDAWRPFEKGPRNCIGQELAMIESKVIVALVVKDFDFVAEFDGEKIDKWAPIETCEEYKDGVDGEVRKTIEGHRCYQILKGAAKPAEGMPGRMSLRRP